MKYTDGIEIKKGDRVRFSNGEIGLVVFSIDNDEYTEKFPKDEWCYLEKGIMTESKSMGLVHYKESPVDLELVERAVQP